LVFAGLLMLHAIDASSNRLLRLLFLVAFLLSGYSIFISFSRASWLAGLLVLMGSIYLYPKSMLKLALFLVPIALVLAGQFFSSQLQWARERLYSTESEQSAISRLPVMYAAYRMFEAKPFFGWGYGNFDLYDRRFQAPVAGLGTDNKDHASHNLYLTIIAEQGLVGIFLFIVPLLLWLVRSLKIVLRLPKTGLWSRKLLILLWLALLSHIVVNNFANMRVVYGLGLWWLTLGLIANLASTIQPLVVENRVTMGVRDLLKTGLPARGET
jgi:O-antigen ligase